MAEREHTETRDGLPVLAFPSQAAWEGWLERHHGERRGVWLRLAKKGAGVASVTYAEALDGALCFGWIDGQKAPGGDRFWLQRFTPRSPRSRWSKRNRERAEQLEASGRMRPAGQEQVDRARADGRWEAAYAGQASAAVPDDLARALDASPRARDAFAGLDGANRYAILYRVEEARRPETRARRIAAFVAMLEEGRTPHPRPAR